MRSVSDQPRIPAKLRFGSVNKVAVAHALAPTALARAALLRGGSITKAADMVRL